MNQHRIPRRTLAVLATLALCACAGAGSRVFSGSGLYTGAAGVNEYPEAGPGETAPLARMYQGAPPMIPHSVSDFAITRGQNDCLSCHADGGELGEGHIATKIPASHYKNDHTGERAAESVLGIRYNCLQCHAPQSAENPPVGQNPG